MDSECGDRSVCIIAIFLHNKRLGISVYDEETSTISVDGIIVDGRDMFDILHDVKRDHSAANTLLLLSPSIVTDGQLLAMVTASVDGSAMTPFRYKTLRSAMWNAATAQDTLCNSLFVKALWQSSGDNAMCRVSLQGNFLRISSAIDFDNTPLKQAAAGLVGYMAQNGVATRGGFVVVSQVDTLQTVSFMHIDKQSFDALEIFALDAHPNVYRGPGRPKEGFSLFGLFDRTRSKPGRARLREWMNKPFYDLARIRLRQSGVAMVVNVKNTDLMQSLSTQLKALHSISNLLLRIKNVAATHTDWFHLQRSLEAIKSILRMLTTFMGKSDVPESERAYVAELLKGCDAAGVNTAVALLDNTIDFEASVHEGALCVRDGFNAALDELRGVYKGLDERLLDCAHAVLRQTPLLSRLSVEYVSQIGYLVAIDEADAEPELLPSNEFQMIFEQDRRYYFKHACVHALDNDLGDIYATMFDAQKALIRELEVELLEHEAQLRRAAAAMADLDALLAFGAVALDMDFVCPEMTDDGVIAIKQGRHPQQ